MIQTAIESPSFHVYGILKLVNLLVDKPLVTVKKIWGIRTYNHICREVEQFGFTVQFYVIKMHMNWQTV